MDLVSLPPIVVFLGQNRNFGAFLEHVRIIRSTLGETVSVYYQHENQLSPAQESRLLEYDVQTISVKPMTDQDLLSFDPELLTRQPCALRKHGGGIRRATIWRQVVDIRKFLEQLDEAHLSQVIIRCRPDVELDTSFWFLVKNSLSDLCPLATEESPFDRKIWVQWASAIYPMYLNDTVFAGTKADLLKMISPQYNVELARYYPSSFLPMYLFAGYLCGQAWFEEYLVSYMDRDIRCNLADRNWRENVWVPYLEELRKSYNVQYFEGKWYLQWLNGQWVTRDWIRVKRPSDLVSLPKMFPFEFLGPLALEDADTIDSCITLATLPVWKHSSRSDFLSRTSVLRRIWYRLFLFFRRRHNAGF